MNRKPFLVALFACLLITQTATAEEKYTMQDLMALDKQGSFEELLHHINDIRPTKRDKQWQALAQKSAVAVIDGHLKNKQGLAALSVAEQVLTWIPKLSGSKTFMKKRAAAGLAGFSECFIGYNAPACYKNLMEFAGKDPDNFDFLFKAGKMARLHLRHHAAVPIFVMAFESKTADKAKCADDDVGYAVKSGLSTSAERFKETVKLAFELCFNELKPVVLQTFYDSHSYSLCAPLQAKKSLSPFQQAYCADITKKKSS